MTRPVLDRELWHGLYTDEHRAAGVSGAVTLSCQIMASGVIKNCVELEPLPAPGSAVRPRKKEASPLAAAVIERLHRTTATPARYKGRNITIDYLIQLRFQ